jgi:hypothetical protein
LQISRKPSWTLHYNLKMLKLSDFYGQGSLKIHAPSSQHLNGWGCSHRLSPSPFLLRICIYKHLSSVKTRFPETVQ